MDHAALRARDLVQRILAIAGVVLVAMCAVSLMGMIQCVRKCVFGREPASNGRRCPMQMHAAKRKQYQSEQNESGQSPSQFR